jgi:chromosome segregation ATPase
MKALEILKEQYSTVTKDIDEYWIEPKKVGEAIKELDAYITNYQGIKRRLESTIKTLAVFENENKSLVKTLEKMNEEMIELRKENQDLKESNNELLEGLKSTQKRLEEWLEKCK